MSNFKEVTVKNVERLNEIIVSQASAISTLINELEIAEKSSDKYREWWLEESKKHEATKIELSDIVEVLDVIAEQEELVKSIGEVRKEDPLGLVKSIT
tara:strand:+ start:240 stop:533 length:294 start_codon:yes stop_codon:yes gene_type:complete